MPFDWNSYLTLAEELAEKKEDEASQRTAISRAYYCVFNHAFARAEITAGRRPRKAPYHAWCWGKYTNTADPACRQIGLDGDRMKSRRVLADYKADKIYRLNDEVRRVLLDARQFLADLQHLDPRYPSP